MKLETMFPKRAKFKLSTTGKTYNLRELNLEDNLWIRHHFQDRLEEIFNPQTLDIGALSQIVYRVIVNKSDFKKTKFKEIDDDGNEVEFELGGYKLFQRLIGRDDIVNVIWAFNETMGISRPVETERDKKKAKKVSKKKVKKKVTKKKSK